MMPHGPYQDTMAVLASELALIEEQLYEKRGRDAAVGEEVYFTHGAKQYRSGTRWVQPEFRPRRYNIHVWTDTSSTTNPTNYIVPWATTSTSTVIRSWLA